MLFTSKAVFYDDIRVIPKHKDRVNQRCKLTINRSIAMIRRERFEEKSPPKVLMEMKTG